MCMTLTTYYFTSADSSGLKEDMQNTSKDVSASSSSMFTLDSTVDSSVEEIQGITQGGSFMFSRQFFLMTSIL